MKYLQSFKCVVLSLIILVGFSSCTKDDMDINGQKAAVTVNLKSNSSQNKKVFLDIQDVQVKVSDDSNAWISLNTINAGTHNVSDFRTDTELLLVDHFEINPTLIHEIRLVLGDNNFMNVNGTLVNLELSENASTSNIVQRAFEGNHIYEVLIDINIEASIASDQNDSLILNPQLYTEIRKF